jgi:hypothetical protein
MAFPSESSIATSKRVFLVALGLAIGVLLALLTIVFVLAQRSSSEVSWPVVRLFADPGLFAMGSFAILILWLTWEIGFRFFVVSDTTSHSFGFVAISLRALALGFLVTAIVGGGAMALVPGHSSDNAGGIELVPLLPPASTPTPRISYVVFFPNGSSDIPRINRAPLRHFLHELAQCHGLTIRVMPFVSSAAYPTNDKEKELCLIQKRHDAVTLIMKTEGLHEVDSHWQSLEEMQSKRGFVDLVNAQRLRSREAFNRRVEILVSSYGDCGESAPQSAPPPGRADALRAPKGN